ncbi:MAG: hypothetical protein WC829_11290 [Hyphomicrobium sp.]|jgi:hypothetical protein
MIETTFDLWIAIAAIVLLPAIIWVNAYNRTQGIMGYLWTESPNLVRIGLVFLSLIWIDRVVELAGHFGLLATTMSEWATIVLGISMFALSLAILVMATLVTFRYLRSRRSP